jgi:ketosteroid isomerase-like protein
MSRENVEVVQRMYKAFHGADADGSLAHFDSEVAVDASSRVDGEVGRGRKDLSRIIASWLGAFDAWHEEIEEIRDLGERVYVVATQRGRGKGSGLNIETRYAVLYDVHGGKITSITLYMDPAEALAAVGLSE